MGQYNNNQYNNNQYNNQYNPYNQGNPNQGGGAGLAIASMVLGIVSLVISCCIPYLPIACAIVGVILAAVSLSQHRAGKGMAIAGLVCSIIALVPAVLVIVGAFSLATLF